MDHQASQSEREYRWQAVDVLDTLQPGHYALWNKEAGSLTLPSGSRSIPDTIVENPYAGWNQCLEHERAEAPWFGASLPGPYSFRFKPEGREAPGAIGRSGFVWPGDQYAIIGKGASPAAKRWWDRLGRHVRTRSTSIAWPSPAAAGRLRGYAFPGAYAEILRGRAYDVNP